MAQVRALICYRFFFLTFLSNRNSPKLAEINHWSLKISVRISGIPEKNKRHPHEAKEKREHAFCGIREKNWRHPHPSCPITAVWGVDLSGGEGAYSYVTRIEPYARPQSQRQAQREPSQQSHPQPRPQPEAQQPLQNNGLNGILEKNRDWVGGGSFDGPGLVFEAFDGKAIQKQDPGLCRCGTGWVGDGVLVAQVLFLRRSMGKRLKNRTQGLRIGVKRGAHGG